MAKKEPVTPRPRINNMKHTLPILTLIATLAFVTSPLVTDPFSGFAPDRFPVPQIDPPVQPAGYAFSIWGVIYIWLTVMAVVGVTLRRHAPQWQGVHLPLILSLGPGAAWLWVAGFAPRAATVLIFWMMATAIWALLRSPSEDRFLLRLPVALYAGWLTAAAHVSLGINLGGFGIAPADIAAVIALALASGVMLLTLYLRPDLPEYGLAFVWALVAVIVANWGGAAPVLIAAALALVLVLFAMIRGLRSGQLAHGL